MLTSANPTAIDFHDKDKDKEEEYKERFIIKDGKLQGSEEYGIPIIQAIVFDEKICIPSLNMPNHGQIPEILDGMCVEGPCMVDGEGIHPIQVEALPTAITAMINQQGAIHRLIIEAFAEKSRMKLLQAMLVDPCISNYRNAVALINEMFEMQKGILPEMNW